MPRGRSDSPRPVGNGGGSSHDVDIEMDGAEKRHGSPMSKPTHDNSNNEKSNNNPKVVVITNLTRNIASPHLQAIFGFYGSIAKIDLPVYPKSGQSRGKAAIEFSDASSAAQAVEHMNGGQMDGTIVKVELSDLPIRSHSKPRGGLGGRIPPRRRISRSFSSTRSFSRSRSPRGPSYRSRRRPPPPPPRDSYRASGGRSYGRAGGGGRSGPPPRSGRRGGYSPTPSSRSRSRSPPSRYRRSGNSAAATYNTGRRRSPSYSRGGYGRRGRSISRSPSLRSSRSRSYTRSRSPRSYRSYSSYSRSRSRTRSSWSRSRSYSRSRGRRSRSRDDIRDSRSRSRSP